MNRLVLTLVASTVLLAIQPAGATAEVCGGDCDDDGRVTVAELVTGAGIALGETSLAACVGLDTDGDRAVGITELVTAVGQALDGCPAAKRPNIVWIVAEDMNLELGAFGDPVTRTPNLDRLASEGIRYTNVYSPSGVCGPSRAALITGTYPTAIGAQHMRTADLNYRTVPPPDVKAFTESLRAAGYYCINNGKTDYQFGGVFDGPFTVWDESGAGVSWRNRSPGQPFFAYLTLLITHESQHFPKPGPTVTNPDDVVVPPYYPDTPAVREELARYYDNIATMDGQAGRILEMLAEDGLADDTIVLFFGDNGKGFPRDKRWAYDGGIHVPLIVRWPGEIAPGGVPGGVNEELVSFVDFAPTMLSLASVDVPPYIQGQVFLGADAAPPREYVYAATDRHDEATDRIRAVRDRRYKYIRNYQPDTPYGQSLAFRSNLATMQEMFRLHDERTLEPPADWYFRQTKPVEELYDTATDPFEIDDLAGRPEMGDVLARLRAAHEKWLADFPDLGAIPEAEMVESMWPGGVQPVTDAPQILPAAGTFDAPVVVTISVDTEGASIGYTLDDGPNPHWQLYTGSVVVPQGATLRAKAIRYGYAESDVAQAAYEVRAGPAPPPNVVLIFADDLGYLDVGAFGATDIATPNIDSLAADGIRLTDFYAAPSCTPARGSLMTGAYAERLSLPFAYFPQNTAGLHPDEKTLAEVLAGRGFATAMFGKWHLGHLPPFLPTRQGFQEFFGLPYSNDMSPLHPLVPELFPDLPLLDGEDVVELNPDQSQLTRRLTERAVDFIDRKADGPFFLYLAHPMPHIPIFASSRFLGTSERGVFGDVVAEVDWSVGQVLQALERHSIENRTLVIFLSDNGPWLVMGNHGGSAGPLREGKNTTFEGGVRVPALMRWPGRIPAGAVAHQPASVIDILPTIARLTGSALPEKVIDGKNIWAIVSGAPVAKSPHEAFYFYHTGELHALRSGRWKLHVPHGYDVVVQPGVDGSFGALGRATIGLALFDLESDPGETTDVAAEHPDVVERLLTLVEKARVDLGDSLTGRVGSGVRPHGEIHSL